MKPYKNKINRIRSFALSLIFIGVIVMYIGLFFLNFKRKKKQLDRVFSSSQPNLVCSDPAPFLEENSPEPGSSSGQSLHHLGTGAGASTSKPEFTVHGSPNLAVSHLIMSHQKSSSLGSACFEKLVVESGAVGEDEELRKNASDSVSKYTPSRTTTIFCRQTTNRHSEHLKD